MSIVLLGFMGCGKTTLGKALARALKLPWVDLDAAIEVATQKTIPTIFKEDGEEAFRKQELACLTDLLNTEDAIVSTGGGAPCSEAFWDLMANHETLFLDVPLEELMSRIGSDSESRPLWDSGQSGEEHLRNRLTLRGPWYVKAKHRIAVQQGESQDETLEKLLECLPNYRK